MPNAMSARTMKRIMMMMAMTSFSFMIADFPDGNTCRVLSVNEASKIDFPRSTDRQECGTTT